MAELNQEPSKKKKRNYPKERKLRNTDYSTITQLIKSLGLEKVKEISTTLGMYSGAKLLYELSGIFVPDSTILSMRKKFGWVRVVSSKKDCNARSIINGKVPVDHFMTIKFLEDITNEIL
jgi:hypothetical protein